MIGNTNAQINGGGGVLVTDHLNILNGTTVHQGPGTTAVNVQRCIDGMAEKIQSATTVGWASADSWSDASPSTCFLELSSVSTASRPIIGLCLGNLTDAATIKQRQKAFGAIDKAVATCIDVNGVTKYGLVLYSYSKRPSTISSVCSLLVKGY